jgi:ribose 5-phosphate isomerase A
MDPDLAAARDSAAWAAAGLVQDGMVVGLGTGDTAGRALVALGARVADGLSVVGVPTSRAAAKLARACGILVRSPDDVSAIDLTVDGADEVDPRLDLIKGAGGALTREKLVATASRHLVIVVDRDKRVARLGDRSPLPVAVLPFCAHFTIERLRALGLAPRPRLTGGRPSLTDDGALLVDCRLPPDRRPAEVAAVLDAVPGVLEHGLFLGMATLVYVGHRDRLESLAVGS